MTRRNVWAWAACCCIGFANGWMHPDMPTAQRYPGSIFMSAALLCAIAAARADR